MVLPPDALPQAIFQTGQSVRRVLFKFAKGNARPFGDDFRDQLGRDFVKDQRLVALFRLQTRGEFFRIGSVGRRGFLFVVRSVRRGFRRGGGVGGELLPPGQQGFHQRLFPFPARRDFLNARLQCRDLSLKGGMAGGERVVVRGHAVALIPFQGGQLPPDACQLVFKIAQYGRFGSQTDLDAGAGGVQHVNGLVRLLPAADVAG